MRQPAPPTKPVEQHPRLWLCLVLLASFAFMLFWGSRKSDQAYHVDEIWQFSFANSYGGGTKVIGENDLGKWLSPEVFRDYTTVQPGQKFSIREIMHSAEMDLHPPLSHLLLNAVSSYFPNAMSKWFGLSINIAAYLLTVWMLYHLALVFFTRESYALTATSLWAFSLAAVNTVMYIRMYCLLTLFSVVLIYCSVQFMRKGGSKYLAGMFAATVLGGLTEYIFWIFGCFTTLSFMAFNYRRSLKDTVAYAAVSLLAFLSACVIFPATITQFTNKNSMSHQANDMFKLKDQLVLLLDPVYAAKRFLNFSSFSLAGITYSAMGVVLKLALIGGGLAVAVVALLCLMYTFRRPVAADPDQQPDATALGAELLSHLRRAAAVARALFVGAARSMRLYIKNHPLILFTAAPVLLTTYTLAVVFPDFGIWTVRAFFFVFPFYFLAMGGLLVWLYRRVGAGRLVLLAAVVLLVYVRAHAVHTSPFLMQGEYDKLHKKVKGASVIVALDSEASYLRLPSFSPPLAQARGVYVLLLNKATCLQEMMKAISTAEPGTEIKILNTLGVWPDNATAAAFLGPELLLTTNDIFMDALHKEGYTIKVIKRLGHLFQWFNLYQVSRQSGLELKSFET